MGLGRYMDGCGSCMKYSLFFINLLTFIGGIIVVGLGVWIVVDKSFATELLGTNLYTGAVYILIATGVFVALVSCFGCFGAAQEVRCMLVTYFLIVFLIFVVMLVGGILGYVFRGKVETTIRNGMESNIHNYNTSKVAREAWDDIQSSFQCCGIDSHYDWKGALPDSCCRGAVPGVQHRCQYDDNLYKNGCYHLWVDSIKKNAAIIGGAGIAVACIMLLGMVFSCALINMIE